MIAFYCVPHARLETEVEHVAAGGKPRICRPCADLMGRWLDVKASDLRPGASFAHGAARPTTCPRQAFATAWRATARG